MRAIAIARRDRVLGLSLVELMIAMVIGLILMAGLAQILLSGKRSFNTQSGLGTLQESGRFALFFLQRDLSMAGFPREVGPSSLEPSVNSFIVANTTNGPSGTSDQVEVNFNSDPAVPFSYQDCLGQSSQVAFSGGCADGSNPGTANGGNCSWRVTNRYFVQNGALMCLGIGNAIAQPMVNGVESFQILYGVDTDGDSYANVYRHAGQVAAADWANNVVSMRVAVLLNSQETIADSDDTQQYAILDAPPITPINNVATPVNELRMRRRVFTTTIELRNRTQ